MDDLLRHPDDKSSIGLILCKTRSRVVAEYALRDVAKPVGVARYLTKLVESLPKTLRGSLPTVKQIEAGLKDLNGAPGHQPSAGRSVLLQYRRSDVNPPTRE
ncbi:MAG: DUF1016 domain-containing protein [Planctomycetaceae bacterium]|nr:DUF1016 domain-containing protein [Planctomycetaceae bacterium]